MTQTPWEAAVISLEGRAGRLEAFRRRLGPAAGGIAWVPGVDGQRLDAQRLLRHGLIEASTLTWPRGQLGCALSHLRCLLRAQRSGRPLLIFEDDALVPPDWELQLTRLLADPSLGAWDLLLLGWNGDSCLQLEWAPGFTATALFQPRFPDAASLERALAEAGPRRWFGLHTALGLAGYLVSPAGAARILEWALPLRTLPIRAPELPERPCFSLDGQLNGLYPQLNAWVCVPPLVLGANDKASSQTAR